MDLAHLEFKYYNYRFMVRDHALKMYAGKVVAIDGPAGSGKSTVARLVAQRLVEKGVLALRGGILLPASEEAVNVSPMGRQLLQDLRKAGANGLELRKMKITGARKELRNLVRADRAVSLDGEIYYDRETYLELVKKLTESLEWVRVLSLAEAKSRTALSRKYIIPLLNRMESDGYVKRSGDERIVTAKPA